MTPLQALAIVDDRGELTQLLSGTLLETLLLNVKEGEHAIFDPPPQGPCWWDFDAQVWNVKPPSPGASFIWDTQTKEWRDPRPPEQVLADQWDLVRGDRVRRLSSSDWVVARAYEQGVPVPEPWRLYRQALRDVTLQPDPFAIHWPEQPID